MAVATISPVKRFAEQHGLKVSVVKAIGRIADEVEKTGEEHCDNRSDISEHRFVAAQKKFLAIIKANGFTGFTVGSSFRPILVKDGEQHSLPH